jgi:hypothetical protein
MILNQIKCEAIKVNTDSKICPSLARHPQFLAEVDKDRVERQAHPVQACRPGGCGKGPGRGNPRGSRLLYFFGFPTPGSKFSGVLVSCTRKPVLGLSGKVRSCSSKCL